MKRSGLILLLFTFGQTQWATAQFTQRPPKPQPPVWALPRTDSLLEAERSGYWLVEVECVAIEDITRSLSRVKIIHNFTGPQELIGQQLVPQSETHYPARTVPLMPVGSKAIFEVQLHLRSGKLWNLSGTLDSDFPAFEGFTADQTGLKYPSYQQALEQAQFIEKVAHSPREKQLRLLRSAAKSSLPNRSSWGISNLGKSGETRAFDFLLSLVASPTLPLQNQIALDAALSSAKEKAQWTNSLGRFDLLQRLVTSKADANTARDVVMYLVHISSNEKAERQRARYLNLPYSPPIGRARLEQWLRLANTNRNWTQDSRDEALSALSRLA